MDQVVGSIGTGEGGVYLIAVEYVTSADLYLVTPWSVIQLAWITGEADDLVALAEQARDQPSAYVACGSGNCNLHVGTSMLPVAMD